LIFLIYFYFLLGHLAPPASPQFLVGVTPKSLKVSFSKKESPTLTPFFLPLPGPATPEKRVFKFPFCLHFYQQFPAPSFGAKSDALVEPESNRHECDR